MARIIARRAPARHTSGAPQQGRSMRMKTVLGVGVALLGALTLAAARTNMQAGENDITGVVTGPNGPEAGVWVIAETTELPTKFVRIVVTDDRGRYLIPGLPTATYDVWVRGYGLVDSERQPDKPGRRLDLKAEVAPDARRAAQVYPAAWWLSTLTLPDDKEFHKKFTMDLKECFDCHQLGNKTTRELGTSASAGPISSLDVWDRQMRTSSILEWSCSRADGNRNTP